MRSRWVAVSSTTLSVLALTGCGSRQGPAISVSPARSAQYQPIEIKATGLKPHEQATVLLRSTDARGIVFASAGVFHADASGQIDLARTAPTGANPYFGAWQMGLMAEMSAAGRDSSELYVWGSGKRTFTASVRVGAKDVAHTTFTRSLALHPLRVKLLSVSQDGLQGGYAAPRGGHDLPAVLELGGSEGGPKLPNEAVADNGVAVLSVGYFDVPGLPKHLVDIPLEYFHRALLWLDRQPEVDPERVTVMGTSLGSEAALLLGVHYPRLVHGVAAFATGSVVTCGIYGAGRGGRCHGSAWSLGGRPLPATQQLNDPEPTDVPAAVIPVERIRGPILVTCGGRDGTWSSCAYEHGIVARLRAHDFRYPVHPYAFAYAGHYGAQLYRYEPGILENWDLALPQNEQARDRLWPKAIAFLKSA